MPITASNPTEDPNPEGQNQLRSVNGSQAKLSAELPRSEKSQSGTERRQRQDRGRPHAVRHTILSRHPMAALRILGEDIRKFRALERRFREELKPTGAVGEALFDRFFSSYLRGILIGRLECNTIASVTKSASPSEMLPSLYQADVPTLVTAAEKNPIVIIPTDLASELGLVQRYDAHYAREMLRHLSLLLILRDEGEDGLKQIAHLLTSGRSRTGE